VAGPALDALAASGGYSGEPAARGGALASPARSADVPADRYFLYRGATAPLLIFLAPARERSMTKSEKRPQR